jgi:hypothetical protein
MRSLALAALATLAVGCSGIPTHHTAEHKTEYFKISDTLINQCEEDIENGSVSNIVCTPMTIVDASVIEETE